MLLLFTSNLAKTRYFKYYGCKQVKLVANALFTLFASNSVVESCERNWNERHVPSLSKPCFSGSMKNWHLKRFMQSLNRINFALKYSQGMIIVLIPFALTRLPRRFCHQKFAWADSFTVAFVMQGREGDEKAKVAWAPESLPPPPPPFLFNACLMGYEKRDS